MEYSYREGDITLCLWANIHRAVRRRGMNRLGFRFWIPTDLAEEDCVIRLMRVEFVPSLPELEMTQQEEDLEIHDVHQTEEIIQNQTEAEQEIPLDKAPSGDDIEKKLETEDGQNMNDQTESGQSANTTLTDQTSDVHTLPRSEETSFGESHEQEMSEKVYPEEENKRRGTYTISPSQIKGHLVDLNEYLLVGGLLHFDFLEVPKLTTFKNGFTYIYREEPILRRKKHEVKQYNLEATYQRAEKIISNSSAKLETVAKISSEKRETTTKRSSEKMETIAKRISEKTETAAESSSEESDDSSEEENFKESIGLEMTLPENIIYMGVPQPALFYPERRAFSTEGVSIEDFDDEQKRISMETDRFGIFGLFQKRYINFPYKNWHLIAGKSVELSLVGQYLTLKIEISDEGCRVDSIKPGEMVLPDLLGPIVWMTPDQIIQAWKYNHKMEETIYNSMALLCSEYDFSRSKWNHELPPDSIALNYRRATLQKEEKYSPVLVRPDRVIRLKYGEEEASFSDEPEDGQQVNTEITTLLRFSLV
ncbi:protein CASC1 [Trichonephila clavata]|uniref:Protein CASC1 n=1 Tax=Trichonephila clavata TaxID=2740835 RepID=A0A8X6HJS7_TRICU|nr:protein CASC1 [Trichonephila clavata]